MDRMPSLCLLLCLAGCATAPEPAERTIPDGAAVARDVRLCRTNVSELRSRLGEPSREGLLGESAVLTWIVEWDPLVRYLGVMAGPDGTVVDVVWNLPSEVTWSPASRCK